MIAATAIDVGMPKLCKTIESLGITYARVKLHCPFLPPLRVMGDSTASAPHHSSINSVDSLHFRILSALGTSSPSRVAITHGHKGDMTTSSDEPGTRDPSRSTRTECGREMWRR
jgi:hypothetical protein